MKCEQLKLENIEKTFGSTKILSTTFHKKYYSDGIGRGYGDEERPDYNSSEV